MITRSPTRGHETWDQDDSHDISYTHTTRKERSMRDELEEDIMDRGTEPPKRKFGGRGPSSFFPPSR